MTVKKIMRLAILGVIVGLIGCSDMSPTAQRTMSGGLIGAGGGALIGAMAGNAGMGAAIGGMVGAGGGFLYSKHKESEQSAYQRGREAGSRQSQ